MTYYEAEVNPDQPWTEDGSANVTPLPPYPDTSTRSLPLEHRDGGPVTVLRSKHPSGLVIIPTNVAPNSTPAILPMLTSSGDNIVVPNSGHSEWPEGIVVLFTS